jgi:hypothetical protein
MDGRAVLMRLNQMKVHVIETAAAADLETALQAWAQAQTEAQYIETHFADVAGKYVVLIYYTN